MTSGVNLNGLSLSPQNGIQMVGSTSATGTTFTETELNLSGDTTALVAWLENSASGFSAAASPHSGYNLNFRQGGTTWSTQININTTTTTNSVQIDIDPFNPSDGVMGAVLHEFGQVLPNHLGKTDTNPYRTATALQKKKNIQVPTCPH